MVHAGASAMRSLKAKPLRSMPHRVAYLSAIDTVMSCWLLLTDISGKHAKL